MSTASSSFSSTLSRASAHSLSYYSGSSSRSSPFSGDFKVDRDGFLDSDHRAGGPYLCSLPATFGVVSKEYERQHHFRARAPEIHDAASSVLHRKGITFLNIFIQGRISRFDPEPEPIPTVLIITETISSQARGAAREIHYSLRATFPNISVDIMEDLLMKPLRSFPVTRSHSIFRKWNDIGHAILATLDFSEWVALGCWRYGVSQTPTENPVTVVGILSHFGVSEVDILFQRNEIHRYKENPTLLQDACAQSMRPGVSIGIDLSTAGSSTLGGLVELQFPDQKWRKFGITCFHCVYPLPHQRATLNQIPGADDAFDRWQRNPVCPGDAMAKRLLKVEHPSLRDLKQTVSKITSQIEDIRGDRFQRVEKQIKARDADPDDVFVDPRDESKYKVDLATVNTLKQQCHYFQSFIQDRSYLLGPVFAGSGYERTGKRRDRRNESLILDWALIEIPEKRLGANMPYRYLPGEQRENLQFQDGRDPVGGSIIFQSWTFDRFHHWIIFGSGNSHYPQRV